MSLFSFCGWSWNFINYCNYISKKKLSLAGPHPLKGKRAGLNVVVQGGWFWTQV